MMIHAGQDEQDVIRQEIHMARFFQRELVEPLNEHYFNLESTLCDVPEQIHDIDHDYGPPRNQRIDDLSD